MINRLFYVFLLSIELNSLQPKGPLWLDEPIPPPIEVIDKVEPQKDTFKKPFFSVFTLLTALIPLLILLLYILQRKKRLLFKADPQELKSYIETLFEKNGGKQNLLRIDKLLKDPLFSLEKESSSLRKEIRKKAFSREEVSEHTLHSIKNQLFEIIEQRQKNEKNVLVK